MPCYRTESVKRTGLLCCKCMHAVKSLFALHIKNIKAKECKIKAIRMTPFPPSQPMQSVPMFFLLHRPTQQKGTCLLTAMPLVVICGQPCSGKSTVATALAEVSSRLFEPATAGVVT